MRRLCFLLLTLLALGCGRTDARADAAAYQIAVIPKSVGFDFWSSVRTGAEAAAVSLGTVEVFWKAATSETDITGQIDIVESFINQQVVAIVIAASNAQRGFQQGLARHVGLRLIATPYSQSDYQKAMSVMEDLLTAYPDLSAVFAANEPSVLGAAQAIKQAVTSGQIVLVGFDGSERQLQGVREGAIAGLIVQNPYQMGYPGVVNAVRALEGAAVPERIDSGITVVTDENVETFMAGR